MKTRLATNVQPRLISNRTPMLAVPGCADSASDAAKKKAADAMTASQANRKAHDDAWKRWMAILAKL